MYFNYIQLFAKIYFNIYVTYIFLWVVNEVYVFFQM